MRKGVKRERANSSSWLIKQRAGCVLEIDIFGYHYQQGLPICPACHRLVGSKVEQVNDK